MEIIVRAKDIELTPHLENYTRKKFSSIKRFIPKLIEKEEEDKEKLGKDVSRVLMEIEIERLTSGQRKGDIYRTEVHLTFPGKKIRAEETAELVKEAVDRTKDDLERQVKKFKEKKDDLQKKGGMEAKRRR